MNISKFEYFKHFPFFSFGNTTLKGDSDGNGNNLFYHLPLPLLFFFVPLMHEKKFVNFFFHQSLRMTMTFINFTPHETFQTKQIIDTNEMKMLHLTNGSFGYKYHNP